MTSNREPRMVRMAVLALGGQGGGGLPKFDHNRHSPNVFMSGPCGRPCPDRGSALRPQSPCLSARRLPRHLPRRLLRRPRLEPVEIDAHRLVPRQGDEAHQVLR